MPNYFSSFRYYTSVPKIVLYFLAGTSHWSWVIYPYFCGIVQRLNFQSYDHFSHRITLASGKVRHLSRAFSMKRESSSVSFIWELKISVGTCSWSHTHTLKLLCTLFLSSWVPQQLFLGWSHLLRKANSLLPCIWASSFYFLTCHPQHPQTPLKSKHRSFLSDVENTHSGVHGVLLYPHMQKSEHPKVA